MRKSLVFAAAAAALVTVSTTPVKAAEFPCRTAKLIVPWGAGGGTGVIFRIIIETVNKTGIKPQLQMVNIGGQGGNPRSDALGPALGTSYQRIGRVPRRQSPERY